MERPLDTDLIEAAMGPDKDVEAGKREAKRQMTQKLQDVLRERYVEMAESIFLSNGGNILDFNAGEPSLVAALRAADESSAAPWLGELADGALPAVLDRRKPRVRAETDLLAAPVPSLHADAPAPPLGAIAIKLEHEGNAATTGGAATGLRDEDVQRVMKRAAMDMDVVARVTSLRLAGHWSDDLPAKQSEPVRAKAHWDHLLDECIWLAKEVAGERRWKMKNAKRVAVAARKGLQEMRVVTNGAVGNVFELDRAPNVEAELKKISRKLATMVQHWWGSIHELLVHKQQAALELQKRAAVNKHLELVVDQTAAFSAMVNSSLQEQPRAEPQPQLQQRQPSKKLKTENGAGGGDGDFQAGDDSDELKTLLAAEAAEDRGEVQVEVDALQREADMDLNALLAQYGSYRERRLNGEDDDDDDDEGESGESGESGSGAEDADGDVVMRDAEPVVAVVATPVAAESAPVPPVAPVAPAQVAPAPVAPVPPVTEGGAPVSKKAKPDDENFVAGDDSDELNTLLAAEAAEDRQEVQVEVDALQREMDMDLNALLAQYGGYKVGGNGSGSEGDEEEEEDGDEDDADGEEDGDAQGSNGGGDDDEEEEGQYVAGADEPELFGTHLLLESQDVDGRAIMEGAAREAQTAQPTGTTLATSTVRTPLPKLLRGPPLREYQHIGLDWLVAMYEKGLNGILADEMGLGKTVMTISLLAHLAERRGIWGPHLVVVPTSVLLNWEKEFKFWHPAFKIMTYYGSVKQRQQKRSGWMRPGAFHVCITTYNIILQDSAVFRRRQWQYLILDEAHNIRNFKSKRWITLLALRARRRLLLTGTPLQNNLMELWSLLHFLMPHIFQSHSEFQQWFAAPMDAMIEGKAAVDQALVDRLHTVLRPFLLRRLKKDVEKQLPDKHEHVVLCRLSKRQRGLYEEFLASRRVRDTLSGGNVLGVMNVLMQLRKVCNHPDLFEERPIVSPYDIPTRLAVSVPRLLLVALDATADAATLLPAPVAFAYHRTVATYVEEPPLEPSWARVLAIRADNLEAAVHRNSLLSEARQRLPPLQLPWETVRAFTIVPGPHDERQEQLRRVVDVIPRAVLAMAPLVTFVIPRARARTPELVSSRVTSWRDRSDEEALLDALVAQLAGSAPERAVFVRQQLYFPDKRLVQYDCGKLQELAALLARLQAGGHRVLIFTQMTRMLDVLETFLTFHHYAYLRLDGTTRTDKRYALMERFNEDKRLFCFILSTRSGGLGINLTGADTVVFFDSDWNPAMDAQAQDRCHRIGQTRTVHIYRLISAKTVEENILRKAWQKRQLERVTLAEGGFNMAQLGANRVDLRELIGDGAGGDMQPTKKSGAADEPVTLAVGDAEWTDALAAVEDDVDRQAAVQASREVAEDAVEFDQQQAPLSQQQQQQQQRAAHPAEDALDRSILAQLDPVQRFAFSFCAAELAPGADDEFSKQQALLKLNEQRWEQEFKGKVAAQQSLESGALPQALHYPAARAAAVARHGAAVYTPFPDEAPAAPLEPADDDYDAYEPVQSRVVGATRASGAGGTAAKGRGRSTGAPPKKRERDRSRK